MERCSTAKPMSCCLDTSSHRDRVGSAEGHARLPPSIHHKPAIVTLPSVHGLTRATGDDAVACRPGGSDVNAFHSKQCVASSGCSGGVRELLLTMSIPRIRPPSNKTS